MKRILLIIGGVLLLIFGLIIVILPVGFPGFTIVFAAIMMLSPHHGKKIITWVKGKIEKFHEWRKKK